MADKKSNIASRIEEEHASLRQLMKVIGESVGRDPEGDFGEWKLELIWTLRDFQNELVKHFDLEEDGGFMDDVIRKAPQESKKAEVLEMEHREFLDELDSITDVLKQMNEQNTSALPTVRERVLALINKLHDHEASERDLIYTVYFQDIGVGD
ncbi:MAG: hemerythrin domain-containing protein [Rhodothermales bacterium]|nr:hemerythrin domain-containing protein [Rhodothermales bacterium]